MNIVHKTANLRAGGFSRMDLVVTVSVVACLAAWLIFLHVGERGRIAACAGNLRVLGHAIHSDAQDHSQELVPAGIEVGETKVSGDTELYPSLNPKLARATGPGAWGNLLLASAPRFHCPSDKLNRGANPRSYAMAARDMTLCGWPPSTEDKTGVGVWWLQRTIRGLLGDDAWERAEVDLETLPRLKLSVVLAPAQTLLLTELLSPNNTLGQVSDSMRVFCPNEQKMLPFVTNTNNHSVQYRSLGVDPQRVFGEDAGQFHFAKFNYLMTDGHVELLTASQTGGEDFPPGGIWTIKAGD